VKTKYEVELRPPRNALLPIDERYKENRLLTDGVLKAIEEWHELKVQKVYRNLVLVLPDGRLECDVLLRCSTPFGRERWIEIELKDRDLAKVLSQAVERRPLADYMYVVVGELSLPALLDPVVRVYSSLFRNYLIGLFHEDQMLITSRYRQREVEYKEVVD